MDWDRAWKDRLSQGETGDWFPLFAAPFVKIGDHWRDVANGDHFLIAIMARHGLSTILCAGNGISQEPRALAEAGFIVTALDLSPTAVRAAEAFDLDPRGLRRFIELEARRPGGHVDFVVGDLLDTTVCPGPFDVIIERRTVQRFPEQERPDALEALAARLGSVGILLSHCADCRLGRPRSPHETGLYHESEQWFRERSWTIWDGAPDLPLTGRVAWLIRSGG